MVDRERILLRAVGDVMRKREGSQRIELPPASITLPPTTVQNIVEAPVVNVEAAAVPSVVNDVDLTPVAEALASGIGAIEKVVAAFVKEMAGLKAEIVKALGAIASKPAPVPVERPKRAIMITHHDDGTTTVEEV